MAVAGAVAPLLPKKLGMGLPEVGAGAGLEG